MAECYYLTDRTGDARDLYCPACAERASEDPAVNEMFEKADADNDEPCVICDKVATPEGFVFPDCYNCGGSCEDAISPGLALYVKFGQPQADPFYICAKCYHDEGKERGVI